MERDPPRKVKMTERDPTQKIKKTERDPTYYPYRVAKRKKAPLVSRSKRRKREYLGEDRISQLPNEILAFILDTLTFLEAGRTSILSRRWRYVWTFSTRRLNFDAWHSSHEMDMLPYEWYDRIISSAKYVRWVNAALNLHQGEPVDELKIYFRVSSSHSCHIDSWVNFAFTKGVKRFELDLAGNALDPKPRYVFQSVGNCQWGGFCGLVTLRLKYVNVTGDVIEHVLGNCPFLQQLQVIRSDHLTDLKVAGPSLKLKYLEIASCYSFKVLEISAINLVSLTYKGPSARILLKEAPVLAEVCIGNGICRSIIFKPQRHLSYLRRLQSLKLCLGDEVTGRYLRFPLEFPELRCLKQLELDLTLLGERGESLVIYTTLIKACPSLSRYAMRYRLGFAPEKIIPDELISHAREAAMEAAKCEHRCLKVVELVGFIGRAVELELVSHLLEIAVSLDEIIIDPHYPCREFERDLWGVFSGAKAELRRQGARNRARQLETNLPPTVKLVVL